MSSWKKYFRPMSNSALPASRGAPNKAYASNGADSWLPEYYRGPQNRLQRYVQYDIMDLDHEVHSALDTLSEFSTQLNDRNSTPFEIHYKQEVSATEITILEQSLRRWSSINDFPKRIFKLFRSVLKYGDQLFIRDPQTFELYWVDMSYVDQVQVNEAAGKKIESYFVKNVSLNLVDKVATNPINGFGQSNPNTNYISSFSNSAVNRINSSTSTSYSSDSTQVDARHVVHFSLTEGMDPSWPFGISVLDKIFKIYKQKELLEDAVLIYRVHRAPERRVFFIDVGDMPPNKAQAYLERIKNDVNQRKIPSRTSTGAGVLDAGFNPMSMLEDYYFTVGMDGRGSKVQTLPGGENLGSIDDLRYFNNKMIRALGVPSSYLPTGPEDGSNPLADGRVGTAFIQEFRFQKTCMRYQQAIIDVFDNEFKLFLKHSGITIDSSSFEIRLSEPTNFSQYRQISIDTERMGNFTSVTGVPFISRRFALRRYLGWTDDEIAENERLWKEEKGLKKTLSRDEMPSAKQVGVVPNDTSFDIPSSVSDEQNSEETSSDTGALGEPVGTSELVDTGMGPT